jgi:hypothetical protein
MILDLPDPQGSIRYLEARTIPLMPPSITGPSGCSTDVSTMTHAPLGRSVLQDLTQINIIIIIIIIMSHSSVDGAATG